jgi:hypothetical protein
LDFRSNGPTGEPGLTAFFVTASSPESGSHESITGLIDGMIRFKRAHEAADRTAVVENIGKSPAGPRLAACTGPASGVPRTRRTATRERRPAWAVGSVSDLADWSFRPAGGFLWDRCRILSIGLFCEQWDRRRILPIGLLG